GKAVHAFLGVEPTEVTPEIAQRFRLSSPSGALVLQVVPGSAAAKAGLLSGDLIVRFGGRPVRTVEDLLAALRHHKPGDRVAVTVIRDGKRKTLQVTLSGRSGRWSFSPEPVAPSRRPPPLRSRRAAPAHA